MASSSVRSLAPLLFPLGVTIEALATSAVPNCGEVALPEGTLVDASFMWLPLGISCTVQENDSVGTILTPDWVATGVFSLGAVIAVTGLIIIVVRFVRLLRRTFATAETAT